MHNYDRCKVRQNLMSLTGHFDKIEILTEIFVPITINYKKRSALLNISIFNHLIINVLIVDIYLNDCVF